MKKVSTETQNLLAACLKYNPKERADWKLIFGCKLFRTLPKIEDFDNRLVYILRAIET